MTHPLERIPQASRPAIFLALLACTLLLTVSLNFAGAPLYTPQAPNGIVSFEFAGNQETAQVILSSWDAQAQVHAGFVQGLDYLYLIVYSTTFGLGCLLAGAVLRRTGWPLARLDVLLAWGLWLAAIFDAIENLALVVLLFGTVRSPWPQIAAACAALKFGLLFLGLVYIFYGASVRFATGLLTRQRPA